MATGGGDSVVDSRITCSICLEPFKGRHPKILTCFHTFCLPCLTQLTDRRTGGTLQTSADDSQRNQDDKDGVTPVRIICPTCRSPTSVPPAGVKSLQTNFYLDDGEEEEEEDQPRTFLCDLCEEGQTAQYNCTHCSCYFCSRCYRSHDRFCKSGAVQDIRLTSQSSGQRKPKQKAIDEEELIGKVLKKLSEDEKRLGRERRAREHDIQVRHATIVRHAGEARDVSLASLRDITEVLSDALHSDVSLAKEKLKQAQQLKGGSAFSTPAGQVLTETDRRHFEEILQKSDSEALLKFRATDNMEENLVKAVGDFLSPVVASDQDIADTTNTEVTSTHSESSGSTLVKAHRATSPGSTERDIRATESTCDLVAARSLQNEKLVSVLQTQNSLLCRDLASLHDKNAKLCADVAALQKEMTSLRKEVRDDVTSLQRDQASVRDKNSLLCQENKQLRDDVIAVRTDQGNLRTDVTKITADQRKLQTDQEKLQTDVSKLQTDRDKLQTDVTKLQTDRDKLQTDVTKLQTDRDKLQTDVNKLTADQSKTQTEQTQLVADVGSLKKDVGHNQQDNHKVRQDVKSIQGSLKQEMSARAALETKIGKVGVQVAFHCRLTHDVTTTSNQTLICDNVIYSVGGGYNSTTGVFTAPVSGLYCFMATSSPFDDDVKKIAQLDVVLECEEIGYLSAWGKGKCTAHTAVQVTAGQRVWLKTSPYGECIYAGYSTCFTGMLVQPEL